jgi:hypothetical protein
VLGAEPTVLAGVARLLAPGATGKALGAAYARAGLRLLDARPATLAEVGAARSSWARRLRAGTARPVTLLGFEARREGAGQMVDSAARAAEVVESTT